MQESNDFLLEGLPKEIQNKPPEEEENEPEGIFIHEVDPLQKSTKIKRRQRQTIRIPKSRYNIEDENISGLKVDRTEINKDFEVIDGDGLDYWNNEQDIIEPSRNYLDISHILDLEDPFTRISRPVNYYNRISAFNQRLKTNQNKKKKKAYFFKQKPKTTKEKDIISSSSNSKTDEENKTDKSGDIENSGQKEKIKKEEDEEEEVNDDEENIFIEVSRPSFISRNSIDLEYNNEFEVEVMDSVAMTVLQVINCMIKANLVQIALCIKELGLIWGPITIILIALMSLISLNLILEVNKLSGQRSYLIFSEMIFGHLGSVIILICQFMSAFGGCLSYIVIFNKVVPKVLRFSISNRYISDETIFSTVLGVILLFFCYKKDVNIIKAAAKYAVFAILLFFVLTIIDFIVAIFSPDRLISINNTWNKDTKYDILFGLNMSKYNDTRLSNVITAIACIILSYSYHIFTFSIYGCMGKISRKQFFITTSVSVLITTIIYLICGTIGYLLYSDTLTDSILDSIKESWLSSLLSLANVINVIMTFPISFSAIKNYSLLIIGIIVTLIRDCCLWTFSCVPKVNNFRGRISNARISKVFRQGNKSFLMSGKPLVKIPKFLEVLITLLMYVLVFWVASMYTQLKVIFSFTGGVMGNILSFIFPSVFYLGFAKRKAFSRYGVVAVCFILFGLGTMAICITSTIQSLIINKS